MKAILGEFMEIQAAQNNLLRDIAHEENMRQFWMASVEHGTHVRDFHNRSWDPQFATDGLYKVEQKLIDLNGRYGQNQARLEGLRKQLFAAVL